MIIDTVIELSEAEKAKIKQNEQEEALFRKNLHSLINGDKKLASRPLVIGKTTNILAVCGADENLSLTITKKVIEKAMRPEIRDTNGNLIGKTGHNLSEKQLLDSLSELKNPAMVLKSKNNSIVIVTTLFDDKNRNIIIPIDLSVKEGRITVNSIRSSYGRDNFSLYIEKNYNDGNILAINKEKANEIFQSIGKWYPKEETFISFDDSIAYSTANVKYISENFQNFSKKEKSSNEETERNDNVAEISQQELLEKIEALEKQVKEMSDEQQNLKEQIATVNQFVSAITESQNFEQSMSTIESMGKQVLDCGKAEFWCYDGAENKYFTNDENRGGRDWQIAKENMRIAAETKAAYIADGEAYIPIISNDKVAGILVASEKDGKFDKASLDKFSPNGQIANTIDLSLKKEFEHQGRITDELTRLKNRQGAKEYAANTMAHNVNDEKDMCLIMCDIDHFKSINDTYGHDAGDTVLKNVAGILQSGTRQGADSAFRWGGEEMVCVLNCDYDHAMDIAERLRQQIESTTHLVYNADKEPINVSVTISMGVYQVKPDKEITQENAFSFFEEQLKFADELAYKAKETGRNKVVGESAIMYEKNAENAIETAQEVITAGTIDKYGLDIDFKNINEIVLTTATENYIGGIDNDGNERRDNYELAVNGVEIYYSEYHNGGSLVRLESENPFFDMTITIDEALKEIQNFLDEALSDRDKTVSIKYNDGREEYIDPNKLLEAKKETEKTSQITSKYLDSLEQLDDVYDNLLYRNGIFNDEYIEFVDNHGHLPPDLNTAENRALVSEYINIQLERGSNLSENQKAALSELKNEISEIKRMESKLGIDAGDLEFIAETKSVVAWTGEAQKTLDERNARRDEQGRDD